MDTKRTPEISVVIPCYRGGNLLKEALDSTLSQTFRDFEIVLIDNNVDPDTRAIMEQYQADNPDRIRIVNEPEQGVCSARNRGIIESSGTYIALLDEDDKMHPDRLTKQYEAAKLHPEASLIACASDFFESDTGKILQSGVLPATGRWVHLTKLIRKLLKTINPDSPAETFEFIRPSAMLFRKEKAVDAGLFDKRLNPNYGEDYDFCVRLFGQGPFIYLSQSLTLYRKDAPQSMQVRRSGKKLFFLYLQGHKVLTALWEYAGGENPKTLPIFKQIAAFHLQLAGRHFIRYREGIATGRRLLRRAFWNAPRNPDCLKDFLKSFFPSFLLPKLFWFNHFDETPLLMDREAALVEQLFSLPPKWIEIPRDRS